MKSCSLVTLTFLIKSAAREVTEEIFLAGNVGRKERAGVTDK